MTTTPVIKGMGMVPVPALGDLLISVYSAMAGTLQMMGRETARAMTRKVGTHCHTCCLLPTIDGPYAPQFMAVVCSEAVEDGVEFAVIIEEA